MLRTTALLIALLLSRSVHADVILDGNGHAQKVTNIVVNGSTYEAVFRVGSYDDVFGTTQMPTFLGDASAAFQARSLIASQLNNISPPPPSFVVDSLGSATADSFIVPHTVLASSYNAVWSRPNPMDLWSAETLTGGPKSSTMLFNRTLSFARFTAVPEPTMPLSGLAFLGYISSRRRRSQ